MFECNFAIDRHHNRANCLHYLFASVVLFASAVAAAPSPAAGLSGTVSAQSVDVSTRTTSDVVPAQNCTPFLVEVHPTAESLPEWRQSSQDGGDHHLEGAARDISRKRRNVDKSTISTPSSNSTSPEDPHPDGDNIRNTHKRFFLFVMLPIVVILLVVFISLSVWYYLVMCKPAAVAAETVKNTAASPIKAKSSTLQKATGPSAKGAGKSNEKPPDDLEARRSQLLKSVYRDLYTEKGESEMFGYNRSEVLNSEPKFIRRSYHQTSTTSSAISAEQSRCGESGKSKAKTVHIKSNTNEQSEKKSNSRSSKKSAEEDSSEDSSKSEDESKSQKTLQSNFTEICKVPGFHDPESEPVQNKVCCCRKSQKCSHCSKGSAIR